MQNSSVAVPDRLGFFDPEPEHHLSLLKMPDYPAAQGHALLSETGSARVEPPVFKARHAFVLSLVVHIAALLIWSFGEMHDASPPAMNPVMEATLVTWSDLSGPSEKKQLSAGAMESPVVPVDQPSTALAAATPIVPPHAALSTDAGATSLSAAHDEPVEMAALTSDGFSAPPAAAAAAQSSSVASQMSSDSDASASAYASMAKPRYWQNPPPAYPALARLRGQEGIVIINAEILPEGTAGIVKIKSSSGYAALDQSALDAVRTWTFEPARKRGRSVASWVDIPVRFVIRKTD